MTSRIITAPARVPLRPYQAKAVDAAMHYLHADDKSSSVLLQAATGTGKTRIAKAIIQLFLEAGKRCLFIVDTDELAWQAWEAMRAEPCPIPCDMEKASRKAERWTPLIVASVQTLRQKHRLQRFDRDSFGLIVLDEAHVSVSDSYMSIVNYFTSAKVVGITATPDRHDDPSGKRMRKMYPFTAYQFGMRDAIDHGWLVPIHQKVVDIEGLDYSPLSRNYTDKDIEAIVLKASVLRQMAIATIEECGDRQTAVYCSTVEHAYAFKEALEQMGKSAVTIEGDRKRCPLKKRRKIIEDYKAGNIQYITNCQALTKGVDIPTLSCVVYARPMVSRALYEQVAGRATRPICAERLNELEDAEPIERRMEIAGSKKPDCLMVDFRGNYDRHSLIRATWAIDAGIGDERALKIERVARNQQMDLASAANQLDLEELLNGSPPADLMLEVAKPHERPVHYTVRNRDPFSGTPSSLAIEFLGVRAPAIIATSRALPEQVKLLRDCGIIDAETLSLERASALITELALRKKHGLADPRQIDLLTTFGLLPPVQVRKISYDRAQIGVDQLEQNGWVPPAAWADKKRSTAGSLVEAEQQQPAAVG